MFAGGDQRFELIRPLGRGGMGEVHEALDRATGRTVALKRLTPSAFDADTLARFQREAGLLARLSHPGIVSLLAWGTDPVGPWLAMEYCPGGSLEQLTKGQPPLAPPRVAEIGAQVARALLYAHEVGIVHRDLKPANLLLDRLGQVKLADFGLARPLLKGGTLTATGVLLGTPGYAAPEQLSGEAARVGPAADVYGLGATLYALLAGRPPFAGAMGLKLLEQVLREPPPPLARLCPGIDPGLERLVLRCLEKDPADRPALPAVEAALEQLSVARPTRRGRRVASIAAPILLASGLGAALALRTPPPAGPAADRDGPGSGGPPSEVAVAPPPSDPDLQAALAAQRAGDPEGCQQAIDRLLAREPEHPQALALRGRVDVFRGQLAQAEPLIRRAHELAPDDPLVALVWAHLLLETARWPEAWQALDRVLAQPQPPAEAWLMRVQLRLRSETAPDLAAARADLEQALTLASDEPRLLAHAAIQLAALGRAEEGLELAERALGWNDRRWEAWQARAECRLRVGETAGAIEDLTRAQELSPDRESVLVRLAEVLSNTGHDRARAFALLEARERFADARGWAVRARVRAETGDPEGARRDLRAAEAAPGPHERLVMLTRARVLATTDPPRAIAQVEQVLARYPDWTDALTLRARLLEERDPAQAQEDLERVLRLEPDNRGAARRLASVLRRRGRPEDARRVEQRSAQASANGPAGSEDDEPADEGGTGPLAAAGPPRFPELLALEALKRGDRAASLQSAEPLLRADAPEGPPRQLYVRARLACALGRWERGLQLLDAIRDPALSVGVANLREVLEARRAGRPGPAHRLLAGVEERLLARDLVAVKRDLERIIQLDPHAWEALVLAAQLESGAGRAALARMLLGAALAVDPGNWALVSSARSQGLDLPVESQPLAALLAVVDDPAQGPPALEAWLGEHPQDLDALTRLVDRGMSAGELPSRDWLVKSLARLNAALELRPGHAPALARRGAIRATLGDADGREDLDRAVALLPFDADLHQRRGLHAAGQGDLATVEEELGWLEARLSVTSQPMYDDLYWGLRPARDELAARLEGRSPEEAARTAVEHAQEALRHGQRPTAELYARRALAPLEEVSPPLALDRARLACALGRWEVARQELERAATGPQRAALAEVVQARSQGRPGPTQQALIEADAALLRGDVTAAERRLEAALAEDPHAWEALMALAFSSLETNPRRALGWVRQGQALEPDLLEIIIILVEVHQRVGSPPPPLRNFAYYGWSAFTRRDPRYLDPVLSASPTHPGALALRVKLLAGRSIDPDELTRLSAALDEALRAHPGHPEALRARALLASKQGDRQTELELLERAVRLFPTRSDLRCERGRARVQVGDLDGARADLAWLERRPAAPSLERLCRRLRDRIAGVSVDEPPLEDE